MLIAQVSEVTWKREGVVRRTEGYWILKGVLCFFFSDLSFNNIQSIADGAFSGCHNLSAL